MPKAVPFARFAPAALVQMAVVMAAVALAGCSTVSHFREGRDITPAKHRGQA